MADYRNQKQGSDPTREQKAPPDPSGHNRQTRPAQDRETFDQSGKERSRQPADPDADEDMERDEMGDDRDEHE